MEQEEIDTVLAAIDESTLADIVAGKAALEPRQRYAMRADIVTWARAAGVRVFGTKHMTDGELVALYKEDPGGNELAGQIEAWGRVQSFGARLPVFMGVAAIVIILATEYFNR